MSEITERKAILLGVGFDNDDGHVRVTRGDNFSLLGGSEDTHDIMQEKVMVFNERLKKKGKQIEDLDREEFSELLD